MERISDYKLTGSYSPWGLTVDSSSKNNETQTSAEILTRVSLVGRCEPMILTLQDKQVSDLKKQFEEDPLQFTTRYGTHFVALVAHGYAIHINQSFLSNTRDKTQDILVKAAVDRNAVSISSEVHSYLKRHHESQLSQAEFNFVGFFDKEVPERLLHAFARDPSQLPPITFGEHPRPAPLYYKLRSYRELFHGSEAAPLSRAVEAVMHLDHLLAWSDALGEAQADDIRKRRMKLCHAMSAYVTSHTEESRESLTQMLSVVAPSPRIHRLFRSVRAYVTRNQVAGSNGPLYVPYLRGMETTVPIKVIPSGNTIRPIAVSRSPDNQKRLTLCKDRYDDQNSSAFGSFERAEWVMDYVWSGKKSAAPFSCLHGWTLDQKFLLQVKVHCHPIWATNNDEAQLIECYIDCTTTQIRVLSPGEFASEFAGYEVVDER